MDRRRGVELTFPTLVMHECLTYSAEETIAVAAELGQTLPPNSIVCLFGDLAAGKTTFVKGLAFGAAQYPKEAVNSPTFVYLNIYDGLKTLYHFDLYRVQDADEFYAMGFQEFFDAGGICCIEWSERIESSIPKRALRIDLEHKGENLRKISIRPFSYEEY